MYGSIAVCIFVEHTEIEEIGDRFSTGWIRFPLRQSDRSEQFSIPNVPNTMRKLMVTWSPRWLGSQIEYSDLNNWTMAFPQFTWTMDGIQRGFWHPFANGDMHIQYAGKWSDT